MKLYSFLNNLIDDIDPVWKPISEENEWQNNDSEYQYGKRGNLPQTSCLMSTNEYFDTALNSPNIIIDNVRQGFWQYSKHNSVALLNNINIETYVQQNYIEDLTPEHDVNWYHCSTPASKCIKFGVLYDPVNWFLKNLKFDNNLYCARSSALLPIFLLILLNDVNRLYCDFCKYSKNNFYPKA